MSQIEIIFIRHGEASDAWGDHLDPGLSDNGILQANNLLNHKELQNLKDFSFISSPKSRAIETGKPLAKKFDKKLNIDEVLLKYHQKILLKKKSKNG
jgi:broad specificity phosphatase PhoE